MWSLTSSFLAFGSLMKGAKAVAREQHKTSGI